MAYAPTVNVSTDVSPAPRAEVVFDSLHPDTTSLRSIIRLADRRDMRVRRSVNIAVSDQTARVDHEVPFGVPVTYRAEMLNLAGESLGFTDQSAPVTLAVKETWIHNPVDPNQAVRVRLMASSDSEWSRPTPGETVFPIGRRVGVVVAQPRGGVRGVTLNVIAANDADVETFADLVGNYSETKVPVLCIRVASDVKMRLPRPFFASVLDLREVDVNRWNDGDTLAFRFTADEVAPPTPALIIPLLTRADLNAYYASRSALNADNLTRLDVNRRYDLAGSA